MNQRGFNQLYWGFLFIMLDFRIQGFDILPDVVGYILFALGFNILAANSEYFSKASKLNIINIILSIFSIYEKPSQGSGININFNNNLGGFGVLMLILIVITSLVVRLLVIYYLFMGIKEMSQNVHNDIYQEADRWWRQFLTLEIASMLAFFIVFIPLLNFLYLIGLIVASIILTFVIMGFMKRCGEKF